MTHDESTKNHPVGLADVEIGHALMALLCAIHAYNWKKTKLLIKVEVDLNNDEPNTACTFNYQ